MKYYIALDLPDHEVDPIALTTAPASGVAGGPPPATVRGGRYGSVADMVAEEGVRRPSRGVPPATPTPATRHRQRSRAPT